ncbi:MAG TPA: type II toxin-antitoxin system VapC family toxin [Bacteroidia bacterium]|nr:type II toxin-antitoxin system VapC family toxin [Bacteroidia bacterium]
MTEAIIDTDILVFFFRGNDKISKKFSEYLHQFGQLNLSIISYYEVMAGLIYRGAEKQIREFELFIAANIVIHISDDSARRSAMVYSDLRKKGITIGSSDILIAGIALENDLTLITNNVKHFSAIGGLKIENWNR